MSEEIFVEELTRRADDIHAAPLTVDTVRGRARQIRRRRRTGLAAGVAAAVAAVALAPTALSGGVDRAPEPAPAVPVPPLPDGTYPLTLDAPAGPAPQAAYLDNPAQRLITPDGAIALPEPYDQMLPYGDGWIARYGQEGAELDADLQVERSFESAMGFATSDDGELVAWSELDGDDSVVIVADADAGQELTRTTVPQTEARPLGFLPGGSVVVETTDYPNGGIAYAVVGDGEVTPVVDVQIVNDSSPVTGMVAGQVDYRGDRACSGVRGNQSEGWERCGWTLGQLSPDGRHVLAFRSPNPGPTPEGVAVLDTETGETVVEWSGATVDHAVWEDEDTVLATAQDRNRQTILRLEFDGSATRTTEVFTTPDMGVAVWFQSYPRG